MLLRACYFALFVLFVGAISSDVSAACVCRCVNGAMQPLCSSAMDIPPNCPPTICQIVPPSMQPIPTPTIPPIGTTHCSPQQVLNPYTRQYEWRTVCR
jgi:hypothetical protein